jgi:FkbM family methyltransferase
MMIGKPGSRRGFGFGSARQITKAIRLMSRPAWRAGLRYGIGAAIEHRPALENLEVSTVVDIGANKGQFSLLAFEIFKNSRIFAFEPLPEPAAKFRKCLAGRPSIRLFEVAIAPTAGEASIYVSGRDDSSSLLPITEVQAFHFPGTSLKEMRKIRTMRLDQCLEPNDIADPALLKIDVQGFELEVLKGSESLLSNFKWLYIECSYVEFYRGQPVADEVIEYLGHRNFKMISRHNIQINQHKHDIQADFLFEYRDVHC